MIVFQEIVPSALRVSVAVTDGPASSRRLCAGIRAGGPVSACTHAHVLTPGGRAAGSPLPRLIRCRCV